MTIIATLTAFIMNYAKEPSAPGVKEKRSHVANRKLNSATSYKRLQRTHWIGLSILKSENVSLSGRDMIVSML